jgi:hypothetical protein
MKIMSPAQFDRGYEPLIKREGTYVYTKEGTIESPLQIQGGLGVYSMNKTGGRRKMFVTRLSSCSEPYQPLLKPPFFGVKLLYEYGLWSADFEHELNGRDDIPLFLRGKK